jgi:CheY-like chemotaxis protein
MPDGERRRAAGGGRREEMAIRKVLLVEDEALVAMAAIDKLKELGFEVVEAATAQAAVNHISADCAQFEFAVVDLGLPDRPGEQLIAELKAVRPDLPIIVASGYTEEVLRGRIKPDDGFAFLNKPYDLAGLQRAIDTVAPG